MKNKGLHYEWVRKQGLMISLLLISLYYMGLWRKWSARLTENQEVKVRFFEVPPRTMTGLEVCETLFGVEIRVDVGYESLTKIYELDLSSNSRRKIIKRTAHQYSRI